MSERELMNNFIKAINYIAVCNNFESHTKQDLETMLATIKLFKQLLDERSNMIKLELKDK